MFFSYLIRDLTHEESGDHILVNAPDQYTAEEKIYYYLVKSLVNDQEYLSWRENYPLLTGKYSKAIFIANNFSYTPEDVNKELEYIEQI